MTAEAARKSHRLITVTLDENSIGRSSPDVEQTWPESSDESEMPLSAGARESAMASAAVPKKAATAAIRHPIWPYRVIAVPSGVDGAFPRVSTR